VNALPRWPRAAPLTIVVHAAFAVAFAIVVGRVLADPTAIAQTDFTAFQRRARRWR
jgi:hypothetical protein